MPAFLAITDLRKKRANWSNDRRLTFSFACYSKEKARHSFRIDIKSKADFKFESIGQRLSSESRREHMGDHVQQESLKESNSGRVGSRRGWMNPPLGEHNLNLEHATSRLASTVLHSRDSFIK
ncbi:hypothetical protein LXL04_040131 [Taraxacum kok-saghyz]